MRRLGAICRAVKPQIIRNIDVLLFHTNITELGFGQQAGVKMDSSHLLNDLIISGNPGYKASFLWYELSWAQNNRED